MADEKGLSRSVRPCGKPVASWQRWLSGVWSNANGTTQNKGLDESCAQIGDKSAIEPLIQTLSDQDPSRRVLAIHALVELKATETLLLLRLLLDDNARSNLCKLESVAEAAQAAIAKLQSEAGR